MFILPLRLNASVLRYEFTEDFFSARTRTQTTRTRILGATYLHHREVIVCPGNSAIPTSPSQAARSTSELQAENYKSCRRGSNP